MKVILRMLLEERLICSFEEEIDLFEQLDFGSIIFWRKKSLRIEIPSMFDIFAIF